MSTRITGGYRKTPRGPVRVVKAKAKPYGNKSGDDLESISYDYDAALSQPDLTGFFKSVDKKVSLEDKTSPQDDQKVHLQSETQVDQPQVKLEVPKLFEDSPKTRKTIDEPTASLQSLGPKSEPVTKKSSRKFAAVKGPKSSRIPRAKFAAFSRLPLRSRGKKSSTRVASAKSKTAIANEAPQIASSTEAKPPQEVEIEGRKSSEKSISVVASAASKNVLLEEKCSGVEADLEVDVDEEFTSTVDDSPRGIVSAADPSIAAVLRASKLRCSCRSCHNNNLAITRYRVDSDIWTDSRSSPEVGRYSESGRNGRPKSRRLAGSSRSRGYLDFSTNESETEPTTDFSIYDTRKKQKKRQISSELPRPVLPFAKPGVVSPAQRTRTRPRLRFSFFNTLFDIVFWPFLFLRADRS